jgi:glycosyltransferase involved in cell wall biosynthesis
VPSGAPGPREVFGFGGEVELMLWNGGIWKWLDAPTAIRATAELIKRRPQARLVFMGTATQGPGLVAQQQARALAAELGLLESHVFFNEGWVPYEQRADWLLEADCAVSTHVEHLETRFAFRTRLLDCFWSGLPIVCTAGDELANRVDAEGLGATAPERDPVALAAAMEHVLSVGREAHTQALARVAAAYSWTEVAAPLIDWTGSDVPEPRLGGRFGGRLARGPSQSARYYGVRAGIATRNRLGLQNWPRL